MFKYNNDPYSIFAWDFDVRRRISPWSMFFPSYRAFLDAAFQLRSGISCANTMRWVKNLVDRVSILKTVGGQGP